MHYGIELVPFGSFADPRLVMQIAQLAEQSSWEGLVVWDHVTFPYGNGDPWVLLSAAAAVTKNIKLITGVAALPRYRPHLLARMITSLDKLSQGRLILGAGLGAQDVEFTAFGDAGDKKVRAGMLDEGLELLPRLWSGEPVTHHGQHYTVENACLAHTPLQKPRPAIWIGGDSPPAMRRAARWDGWLGGTCDEHSNTITSPERVAEIVTSIYKHRTSPQSFEIALQGVTNPGQSDKILPYQQAGATWWFESIFPLRGSNDEMIARIQAGPAK
jgi:alkanesulfonate monooxygenase SsuD/methylene tetrahydromethanopterin reductase-like flavin-dependent oxidoreductase (luciferase family)